MRQHTPTQTARPAPRFELCAHETAVELASDIAATLLDIWPNLRALPTFDQLPTAGRSWEDLAEYTAETVAALYYRVVTPEGFDNLVSLAIDHYNRDHAGANPNNYA